MKTFRLMTTVRLGAEALLALDQFCAAIPSA